ncbi:efflux RND transporter periplasmic adaptor subunit [Steroidobacter agaridevorans]|uniref:efflux RND transporter periplasmic adaptor subunit n=1 Tax=Steroidobacter agaridevorans TaxID=2695856 RepID=UPI00132BA74C|nr:HlyD family efflux transporter periplasmic adaptor subunit [Steroidobacter agaridevorans]GFE86881.1 ABC transporter permease [Steroidobacter agaridevorans]
MAIPAPQPSIAGPAMDRRIEHSAWSLRRWPLGARIGIAAVIIGTACLLLIKLIAGTGERTLRLPLEQISTATVSQGLFRDLIPLNARVVPRETVYVDAIDGGRVDRIYVEAGDVVAAGQPIIALSNTNLALQVIQQESQLNQAISQLQQNEIALEQNHLVNERGLAEIDYKILNLQRAMERRETLAGKGLVSREQRDEIADELAYYRRLKPIQSDSSRRQSELRARLLPAIHDQLQNLRGNLTVVHDKLDSLVVRAPVSGRVTALDLKVGENRAPGDRLAEVTPDSGMKLVADIDEFYLSRVRTGQTATVELNGTPTDLTVRRVSPQVRNGQFQIDLDFGAERPDALVAGAAAQGRLRLGGDTDALLLPNGQFIERTGGDWLFVIAADGQSAQRRQVRLGRRSIEQLEVLDGLAPGDRVITSDYTGLDAVDRIVLTR